MPVSHLITVHPSHPGLVNYPANTWVDLWWVTGIRVCFRSGRLLAAVRVCVWTRRCVWGEAAEDQPRRAWRTGSLSHRTPGTHPGGRRLALCSGNCLRVCSAVAMRSWTSKLYDCSLPLFCFNVQCNRYQKVHFGRMDLSQNTVTGCL